MTYRISILILLTCILLSCGNSNKDSKVIDYTGAQLDSVLKIYPDSIELLLRHGDEAIEKMRFEDAMADGARAYRLDSSRLDTRILYAQALLNKQNYTTEDIFRAQNQFKYIIKKDSKNPRALVGLANTYSFFQDNEKAFKYINQALRIDPKFRDAYLLKGSIYRNLGNFERAVSSYETAVQQDPKFTVGYLWLGSLYEMKEDPICIEYYTTAYRIEPKNPDVIYSLAYAKQKFGKEKAATSLYRKMIRLDDTYYDAYFQIGYMKQFSQEDLDSAMFYYEKVLEIEPRHVETYHNVGLIYEERNDISNALLTYAKALKNNPNFELTKERVAILKNKR
jgi:tetratricopeptide (TPR) repeat protein